ncbi:GDP-fucose synthetase, partial [Candidatus Falkowbacteria bacterium CG23_combo_of_CG06-09_8_20_14_all_41_10]
MMNLNSKITVFGGSGLVGSAMVRGLIKQGYTNVDEPNSQTVNLLDKGQVEEYFKTKQPEFIFMIAGLVGGIYGNMTRPADFLY